MELNKMTLGIEFGSTRIKAVLVDENYAVVASGTHDWENELKNGHWTYSQEQIWNGLKSCYRNLADHVKEEYNTELTTVSAMGISGMMHGYLAFDKEDRLLTPFRTWRNTTTEKAANQLTRLFNFNIPQRWTVAHLWQAILNGEAHVKKIAYVTTLAGYIHWQLTGERVVGVGEASGIFPIDIKTNDYNQEMIEKLDKELAARGFSFGCRDIFPKVLVAGEEAGKLTANGARLLDPSGVFGTEVPFCPPEGDAGTGMVATNSVAVRTGNISAGTSVFTMIVLEKELANLHTEIDMVTTPAGKPVAMAHCNTCTSDLDAWVRLLGEMAEIAGAKLNKGELYNLFYNKALEAEADCGGIVSFNYYSGEPITGVEVGCPLVMRTPNANFNLANFARCQLYSAMATLKIGMDILFEQEKVSVEKLLGHGGLFKTPVVGQKLLAGALNVPIAVMETAGEGGPWGMAVLAAYMIQKAENEELDGYLDSKVFAEVKSSTIIPDIQDVEGFSKFIKKYKIAIEAEKLAAVAVK